MTDHTVGVAPGMLWFVVSATDTKSYLSHEEASAAAGPGDLVCFAVLTQIQRATLQRLLDQRTS